MSVSYTNNTEELLKEISQSIADGLGRSAVFLETEIAERTPVLTGFLRSQMRADGKVKRAGNTYRTSVENQVEYAQYIEYGTSTIRARAMFRKGADASAQPILKILSNSLPK